MKIDENTKRVMIESIEIKRIMSEGGVLWEKTFEWKKYNFNEWLTLGESDGFLFGSEMESKFPGYEEYKLMPINKKYTIYGRIKSTDIRGRGTFVGKVKSYNENEYPKRGARNGYWYEFVI